MWKNCVHDTTSRDNPDLFRTPRNTIRYCYGSWQKRFELFKQCCVQFRKGVPNLGGKRGAGIPGYGVRGTGYGVRGPGLVENTGSGGKHGVSVENTGEPLFENIDGTLIPTEDMTKIK